jgi:toxin ParE1/3/4
MADYRLSIAAEADVEALYQFSQMLFGQRQTDVYMEGLGRAFENLAQTPRIGRSAEDLKPELFRFRYQSHMIFYTIDPDRIVIQRVLHARMDFGSRL